MVNPSISLNTILLSRSDCSRRDGDLGDNCTKPVIVRLCGSVGAGAILVSIVRREVTRSHWDRSLCLGSLRCNTQRDRSQLPDPTRHIVVVILELYLVSKYSFSCGPGYSLALGLKPYRSAILTGSAIPEIPSHVG